LGRSIAPFGSAFSGELETHLWDFGILCCNANFDKLTSVLSIMKYLLKCVALNNQNDEF
jgi:hypothetical protein